MSNVSTNMPTLDRALLDSKIQALSTNEIDLATNRRIVANIFRGQSNQIRKSKPKASKRGTVTDGEIGKATYVWRMVVFQISAHGPHQCMPVCADFDLPAHGPDGRWSSVEARKMAKELDVLVDAVVDCVPKSQWHGINRWGRALYGY